MAIDSNSGWCTKVEGAQLYHCWIAYTIRDSARTVVPQQSPVQAWWGSEGSGCQWRTEGKAIALQPDHSRD